MVLVCGVQSDKDLPAVVAPLAPLAAAAVATRARHPRAAAAAAVAEALRAAGCPIVEVVEDVGAAVALARTLAVPSDLILCAGSLYVVGEVLSILEPRADQGRIGPREGPRAGAP
jgi:dihydrofolate synthase/folylpolyglutamate synthase